MKFSIRTKTGFTSLMKPFGDLKGDSRTEMGGLSTVISRFPKTVEQIEQTLFCLRLPTQPLVFESERITLRPNRYADKFGGAGQARRRARAGPDFFDGPSVLTYS